MIFFRRWMKSGRYAKRVFYSGWFLFGFIPLVIRQENCDAA